MAARNTHLALTESEVLRVWVVPYTPQLHRSPPSASLLHRWMMMQMAVSSSFGSRFPVFVLDDFLLEDLELLPANQISKVPSKSKIEVSGSSGTYHELKDLPTPTESSSASPRDHLSYFLESVEKVTSRFPHFTFTLIVGSNFLEGLQTSLKDIREPSIARWNFIVAPRLSHPISPQFPPNFTILGRNQSTKASHNDTMPQPSILSVCFGNRNHHQRDPHQHISTNLTTDQVRHRLRTLGVDSVEGLIPPVVLAHIVRNNLYVMEPVVGDPTLAVLTVAPCASFGSNLSEVL